MMAYPMRQLHMFTRRNITSNSTSSPINLSTTIKLYENNKIKSKYFRIIVTVSGVQLVLWSYLSYFALTEFGNNRNQGRNKTLSHQDTHSTTSGEHSSCSSAVKKASSSSPESLTSWFGSSKWRIGLSLLSLGAGIFFAVTACIYPMRIVRKLTFLRTEQALQFVTYTPLGNTRVMQVPLLHVRSASSEKQKASGGHVALKVRGHVLYFLLDQQQTYLNPLLYNLVGAQTKN